MVVPHLRAGAYDKNTLKLQLVTSPMEVAAAQDVFIALGAWFAFAPLNIFLTDFPPTNGMVATLLKYTR